MLYLILHFAEYSQIYLVLSIIVAAAALNAAHLLVRNVIAITAFSYSRASME